MIKSLTGRLAMRMVIEQLPLAAPFRIAGYTWESVDVLVIHLEKDGCVGSGEAAGVYYKGDRPQSMMSQLEVLRAKIEEGITHESIRALLPPCGARNALDCALWDLAAKLTGCPAWRTAKLDTPRPLLTTFTCGVDQPKTMAAVARSYEGARAIKVKLDGELVDVERILAVREARPDVWLGVDANQGFSRSSLETLMPILVECKVALIEQPFPVGQESLLDGFESPIPIAADESMQSLADIPGLSGRFDVINIKLDKCGGFTEGLEMVHTARRLGFGVMVGNMLSSSLAMAPAFLLGQLCDIVDLDGPLFLRSDRKNAIEYVEGLARCPPDLWGYAL